MQKNSIRSVITAYFAAQNNNCKVDLDDNILETGVIDSFGIVELIGYIEEKYQIELSGEELTGENFESVRTITNLIKTAMGNQ